ncbi:hypothetical protein BT69DRAFT_1275800 [Atractiella rhizophila]|nr:hypothetical protein BT69DRAFT_1275800 [Atractiella rhizophila]
MTPQRLARAAIAEENLLFCPELVETRDLDGAICYFSCPSNLPLSSQVARGSDQKNTSYWLYNMDSFDCAELVRRQWGYSEDEVAVLNMANANHPGGGYLTGAMAQEEALCRRSTLYSHLTHRESFVSPPPSQNSDRSINHQLPWYPFEESGGLWTPRVLVFRKGDDDDCRMLEPEQRFKIGVVSVAALNRPELTEDGEGYMWPEDERLTKRKIETILGIAQRHNQKVVILGAFGCGAFKNPPRRMADLFREILSSDRFRGAFERVVLAILERAGSHNLEPWRESWCDLLEGTS